MLVSLLKKTLILFELASEILVMINSFSFFLKYGTIYRYTLKKTRLFLMLRIVH